MKPSTDKIHILGRLRRIYVKERKKYVTYQKQLIPLSCAKQLEKKKSKLGGGLPLSRPIPTYIGFHTRLPIIKQPYEQYDECNLCCYICNQLDKCDYSILGVINNGQNVQFIVNSVPNNLDYSTVINCASSEAFKFMNMYSFSDNRTFFVIKIWIDRYPISGGIRDLRSEIFFDIEKFHTYYPSQIDTNLNDNNKFTEIITAAPCPPSTTGCQVIQMSRYATSEFSAMATPRAINR
jgi:hypothetical protein